ncbi:MAG: hypothetical protein KKE17_07870 [Proteobacteria bacterium]|nr:hypothetical protein [Pseudomonadota bacterium]MBU1709903.1 hypothetical protein [Pseudomonadota bacterium]
MLLRTCISPAGKFIYGIHQPSYKSTNLREQDHLTALGTSSNGIPIINNRNFPDTDISVDAADQIIEIPNPFPFRGATYIGKKWADRAALNPASMKLPAQPEVSFSESLQKLDCSLGNLIKTLSSLPEPLLLALAATSTDPRDLICLAELSCEFSCDPETDTPNGLIYQKNKSGTFYPVYKNHNLFEVVANNPHLPDNYKKIMVLRPGVQGESPIVGDWQSEDNSSNVFEYLRANSYIPWGHYASNMADNSIRYHTGNLTLQDMQGLRHLYYQRTFLRIGQELGIAVDRHRSPLSIDELESLRKQLIARLSQPENLSLHFSATLWGWNYGFDYAPSNYRLHASHQQIHQQYAMLPDSVETPDGDIMFSFGCGDLVTDFITAYKTETGKNFFENYILATKNNQRMDGKSGSDASLIVHEDDNVMLFVPKAQTSQWELQLMTLKQIGNIIEADSRTRASLDHAILLAQRIYAGMGGKMVTTIEFPKRINATDPDQRLLYSFLPKLPQSMGAMSEAQLRFINGHYPEDFAAACRRHLPKL